ncbi:hypothetical protein A4L73_25735 [Salmonella enterica subsp. enterica serovar Enteritidis]|nr:hypothetical protein [Salmonella enterica subsp. enterica serovar Enteritidis]
MSDDKQNLLNSNKGLTTGGIGAVLTTLVPLIAPDPNDQLRPFLYASAPLISAFITYLMVWVINRHGLESPAEASFRNSLQRDLKGIEKQLKSPHLTDDFRNELIRDKENTIRKLVNIGKTISVSPVDSSPEDDETAS